MEKPGGGGGLLPPNVKLPYGGSNTNGGEGSYSLLLLPPFNCTSLHGAVTRALLPACPPLQQRILKRTFPCPISAAFLIKKTFLFPLFVGGKRFPVHKMWSIPSSSFSSTAASLCKLNLRRWRRRRRRISGFEERAGFAPLSFVLLS